MIAWALTVKLLSGECHITSLIRRGQQAITWANVGPDLYRQMASLGCNELTHWGRDKMDAISQTTFWSAFSWMKMFEFRLKFHWSLFLRVQLTIFQHWFRKWLGANQATSHYLDQWWLDYRRIYASLGLNELNPRYGSLPEWACWCFFLNSRIFPTTPLLFIVFLAGPGLDSSVVAIATGKAFVSSGTTSTSDISCSLLDMSSGFWKIENTKNFYERFQM